MLRVLLLLALAGCESRAPRTGFPVTFRANPDEPLAGVEISLGGGKAIGKTGPDGTLRVALSGREGAPVPIRVRCPAGFRSPREMPALTLRRFTRLDPAARGIEVSVECLPAERLAAIVVKAGQPNLPILAHGKRVARTDADGIAHALVSMPPNSTFRVVIDTSRDPRLRPQNPATTLTVADADEIFLVNQRFEVEEPPPPPEPPPPRKKKKKKKKKVVVSRPKPSGPEKLD